MNKRSAPLFFLLALVGLAGPLASAENSLRVGVQAGIGQWEEDVRARAVAASASLQTDAAATVGVVGQYLMRAGADDNQQGYFIGFEISAASQRVSEKKTIDVAVLGASIPVAVTGDLNWNADLLWLAGYDFGRFSAFLAGGASYLGGDFSATGGGIAGSDSATHLGWKAGPGMEIELGKSSSLLVRANYGVYQSKTYSADAAGFNVGIEVEPKVFDVRVAWVYNFDSKDIFGQLR